jgi:hypothetical protein
MGRVAPTRLPVDQLAHRTDARAKTSFLAGDQWAYTAGIVAASYQASD